MKCNTCHSPININDTFCGECGVKQSSHQCAVSSTGYMLGTLADIKACFSALINEENFWNCFTADISDTDDFFQFFSDDKKTICLSFPIITKRHETLQNTAIAFLTKYGLETWHEEYDNGDVIDLICKFPNDIDVSSQHAINLFSLLFDITETTEVRFQMI